MKRLLFLFPWFFLSCHQPRPVIAAFYWWQTTLALSANERAYLKEINCKRLYIKVLDVGLEPGSGAIVPFSKLQVKDTTGLADFTLSPVVFITNETFKNISTENISWLANKIAAAQTTLTGLGHTGAQTEFQVDCDWTGATREAFFAFLKALRSKLQPGTLLSTTIRLHQYKFPGRSGVPPVDRGILMCYNTGDIDEPEEENSIFNLESAGKYLKGAGRYPLPLDLALPVFSWTLVYRNGELWKIIPGDSSLPEGILQQGTFVAGHYLRPGDLLRREEISPDTLQAAARLAAHAIADGPATVAFFHLNDETPREYPAETIRSVGRSLENR